MTNNHTPGPWECFHAKNEHGEETMGIRGGTCFIATMDTMAIGDGPYRMPESGEANARLIAAAPELLDALREMLHETSFITPMPTKLAFARRKARQLIEGFDANALTTAKEPQ